MSERVFERTNQRDGGFVAGFAAIFHWCHVDEAPVRPSRDWLVHQ
jgi:hypothetical protein